ncbi:nucleotide exchange factor GrpE [Rhodovibrionaceae bacterium A322]
MSEDKNEQQPTEEAAAAAETSAAASGADAAQDPAADAAPDSEQPQDPKDAELEALRQEVAELKDRALRAMAETENIRNRSRREREDSRKYAVAPLAKDILSVADNLARAISSVPAEAAEDPNVKALLEGVSMTEKSLQDAFAKHFIGRIEAIGEKLDPHRHEAMFEVPDPSQPAGTVVQVFEVGYALHDRLLRPARVGVAKGGPAAAPAEPGGSVDTKA